jgi:DNA repair protein RecN (Recombination protein N)
MLLELKISNYALIDDLELSFSPGLNVLSGETGAGKSIVIGAINLLLGERATVDQVRQGEENAYVEGMFDFDEHLKKDIDQFLESAALEKGEELIIAREVFRSGRSVARINGRAVPAASLKELGQYLVDLHGQHQHQSLLRPDQHLELLDSFGGESIFSVRAELARLYSKRQSLKRELSSLGDDSSERERRLDVYAFQLKEISEAKLIPEEDEELSQKENILANAEKMALLTANAYSILYSGERLDQGEAVIDQLNHAMHQLDEAAMIDPKLKSLQELLQSAAAQLEEVSHELRDYRVTLEFDPAELASIQDRLDQINTLKRKYGQSIEEVLAFADRVSEEMERLKNSEELAQKLEEAIEDLEKELTEKSSLLREMRKRTAEKLVVQLERCLQELALPNARFEIRITASEVVTSRGMDQVEFLFSANRGEEVKPLSRIISGGEVSRVMLALKTILAGQDLIPTMIFDEIDSGIGGATIQSVAEKLAQLAATHQVMCVTHSPQIASMADCHFRLFKESLGERTLTRAARLTEKDRRQELARMLDGASIDQVSLQHVESLLERANRYKTDFSAGT